MPTSKHCEHGRVSELTWLDTVGVTHEYIEEGKPLLVTILLHGSSKQRSLWPTRKPRLQLMRDMHAWFEPSTTVIRL